GPEQKRDLPRGGAGRATPRRKQRAVGETFWTVAERVLADIEAGTISRKSKAEWRSTLERYVRPRFGERPIATIARRDVLELLQPLWREKYVMASRLRGRRGAVFGHALASEP